MFHLPLFPTAGSAGMSDDTSVTAHSSFDLLVTSCLRLNRSRSSTPWSRALEYVMTSVTGIEPKPATLDAIVLWRTRCEPPMPVPLAKTG